MYGNTCVASKRSCAASDLKLANAKSGTETWTGSNWGNCVLTDCADGYDLDSNENKCTEKVNPNKEKCTSTGGTWKSNTCECLVGSTLENGYCVIDVTYFNNNGCASVAQNETGCSSCSSAVPINKPELLQFACDSTGKKQTAGKALYKWVDNKCAFNENICD